MLFCCESRGISLIGERLGTENVYLRTWFSSQKTETHAVGEFVCVYD